VRPLRGCGGAEGRAQARAGPCRRRERKKDETLPSEGALVRVDAASEKIRAILALALAVPAIVVRDDRLHFRPAKAWEDVAARLRELAREDPDVARMAHLYTELSDATEYRNNVCHSLSAAGNTYLAPFSGGVPGRRAASARHQLRPKGLVVAGEGTDTPALLARATRVAEEALETPSQAGLLPATVIRGHGVLDCGPGGFFIEGAELNRTLLDDPRPWSLSPSGPSGPRKRLADADDGQSAGTGCGTHMHGSARLREP